MASSEITRKEQIVFGETGASTEFGQFGSDAEGAPATSKDLDVIQSLDSFDRGWYDATIEGSEPPRLEDRNGLDYVIFKQLAYLFQKGIPEWINSATERYYANKSIVTRSGLVYIAILGDDSSNINVQKDPATQPTWWQPLGGTVDDFLTGQGGSSGGSLMQQLGFALRSKFVTNEILSTVGNQFASYKSATVSYSVAGVWVTIAEMQANAFERFEASVEYAFSGNVATGSFFVSCRSIASVSQFIVNFVPGTLSIDILERVGKVRIIASGDTTPRGCKLQMLMLGSSSGSTTLKTVIRSLGTNNQLLSVTPYDDNTPNLQDGSSYATYGQASDDWWRFPAGEVELWSGSQVIATASGYNFDFFSGFSNLMFKKYKVFYETGPGADYSFEMSGVKSDEETASPVFPEADMTGDYIKASIYANSGGNDFYIYNGTGGNRYITKIVGVN